MKNMKRLISMLLVLCMAVSMFAGLSIGASAASATYTKITSAPSDWSGTYLIVYEDESMIFDGSLTTLDAVSNYKMVTISDGSITGDLSAYTFTIDSNGYIKSASGYYIGQTTDGNGLKFSTSTTYANTLSMNADGTVNIVSSGAYLRFNTSSGQDRFRYYKSSTYTAQKAICLYKLEESGTCDHSYSATVTKAATCTTAGVRTYTCSKCDDSYTEAIAALGHNHTAAVTTEATCGTEGVMTYTCSRCGDSYTESIPATGDHSYSNGTCTVCGAADPNASVSGDTYTLVTSVSELQAGDKIVIVAAGYDYAMSSTQNSNNRGQAAITKNSNNTVTVGSDTAVFTLGVSGSNYTFNDGSGYLYAASSGSNYLRTQTTLDENGQWAITISNGVASVIAQGSYTHNIMRYNATSSLFSAYAEGNSQKDIALYRLGGSSGDTCDHNYVGEVTTAATCGAAGEMTYTCSLCGDSYIEEIPATGAHTYGSDGICTVCGADNTGITTPGGETATIKIITGNGTAWFQDSEGNRYALTDDGGPAIGTKVSQKGLEARASVPLDAELTLVLQPDSDQRLSCVEQQNDRLDPSQYTYDSTKGYYTFTYTVTESTKNYFRITFLPRNSEGGYTAVQSSESAAGAAITPGLYVITGLANPENYTANTHSMDTTYLLYGDQYTAVDDNYEAIGRKSSALQLSSVGVSLSNEDPYLMTAVNICQLMDIQPYDETYYTIKLASADYYVADGSSSKNVLKTVETVDDSALWQITYLSDGAYQFVSKNNEKLLCFNWELENLQFRPYKESNAITLANCAPVLYRASKVSQCVTYSVESGKGSIYATADGALFASGSYQTIGKTLSFTFTPAEGYLMGTVTVNGQEVTPVDGVYTCTVVEGTDVDVVANFVPIPTDRNITIHYYVDDTLDQTVTATTNNVYTLNIAALGTENVTGVGYTYDELSFNHAKKDSSDTIYTDLKFEIPVEDGDVIRAYFTSTKVTLDKKVTETTANDAAAGAENNGGSNGGTSSRPYFTSDNGHDEHGNTKQTFEVELYAQSFAKGDDIITGNTDVILVLDNSNSMHSEDAGSTVSGYLSADSDYADRLTMASEVNEDALWSIQINSNGVATITSVGDFTHNTIAYDSTNSVFSCYIADHSHIGTSLWRYYTAEELGADSGGWYKVSSLSALKSGDLVAILDGSTTNYGIGATMDDDKWPAADTSSTISEYFTLGYSSVTVLDEDGNEIVKEGYTFRRSNVTVTGTTNSEYVISAIEDFYDMIYKYPGNRVAIAKFNSYGYAWNGSRFLPYKGSVSASQYDITYENAFMDSPEEAYAAAIAAIKNKEDDDGGTNMAGAWLMTYVLSALPDPAAGRDVVVVFFTDGEPTFTYVYEHDEGYWTAEATGQFGVQYIEVNQYAIDDATGQKKVYQGYVNKYVNGGTATSAEEYYDTMYLAQAVRSALSSRFAGRFSIHNVGLFNESLDEELQLAYPELIDSLLCAIGTDADGNAIMTRQWKYTREESGLKSCVGLYPNYDDNLMHYGTFDYSDYYDAGLYVNNSNYWVETEPYADSYISVTGNVDSSLAAAFEAIAVNIIPGKVVVGTISDTIPAGFVLTEESREALDEAGWTITDNADGSTTIVKENVRADEDGETFTYEIEYQGSGYGATYTNTVASYTYESVDSDKVHTSYFPMPAATVVPWTVNDSYSVEAGTSTVLDVQSNDLFAQLTDAGYTISDFTITTTDANGNPYYYHSGAEGGFDADVDASNSFIIFSTENSEDTHQFYYVVSATVTSPDGETTTVYSRPTLVSVSAVDTVNDVDLVMLGASSSLDLLFNDGSAISADGQTESNSIALYDLQGNPIAASDIAGLSGASLSADGIFSYTGAKPGVTQFCYINTITVKDGSTTVAVIDTRMTLVTILVIGSYSLPVDFGYTTAPVTLYPSLDTCYVDTGMKLSDLISVVPPEDMTGSFGEGAFSDRTFTYTPKTTMFNGVDVFGATVTLKKSDYTEEARTAEPTVTVVPANNIYFEEDFLSYTESGTDDNGLTLAKWDEESAADSTRKQNTANVMYGYDTAYDLTENYSGEGAMSVTVNNTNPNAEAYFTFSGTGFDIYGQSSKDTGVIAVEIYKYDDSKTNNIGDPVWFRLVDTYMEDYTYYQLPIIRYHGLDYGDYVVRVRVVYEAMFDHNYEAPAEKRAAASKEDRIREIFGLSDDMPMDIYLKDFAESSAPATRIPAAANGSYSIVLDGIRIYSPLNTTPAAETASSLYNRAEESGKEFVNLRDALLDLAQWGSATGEANGILYVAVDSAYSGNTTDAPETSGLYLTPTRLYSTVEETVDGTVYTYLVDENGDYIQYEDCKIFVTKQEGTNEEDGSTYYYTQYEYIQNGETKTLTHAQVKELGLLHLANYYQAYGPKFEVYLSDGNGIAFALPANAAAHISAKIPTGDEATLQAWMDNAEGGSWVDVAVISSRTEMYYDLSEFINADGTVMLRCKSDNGAVLSLCNLKLDSGVTPTVSERTALMVADVLALALETPFDELQKPGQFSIDSASLMLDQDINVAYTATVGNGYTDPYMIFTFNGMEYRVEPEDNDGSSDQLKFVFRDLTPECIGDNISATLYATMNGGVFKVTQDTYSVRQYCINTMANNGSDEALKQLLSDLLVYGAKAQLYTGYKTDTLVTSGIELTISPSTYSAPASIMGQTGTATEAAAWVGAGLLLENAMTMYVTFEAANVEGLTIEAQINGRTVTFSSDDFVQVGEDYRIYFRGILAYEFADAVMLTFYQDGAKISSQLTYSVDSYVAAMDDSSDTALAELVKALHNYGASAAAYKAAKDAE